MPVVPDRATLTRIVHAMAMPFTVRLRGVEDPAAAERAVDAFEASLREADDLLSLWRPETPMSRVARGELHVDDAPAEVAAVLALASAWGKETGGAFDARLTARAARRLPVPYPPGAPDPTGVVKSWAVVRALPTLAAARAEGWLVDASGDVVVGGQGQWRVGIADPRTQGDPTGTRPVDAVALGDGSAPRPWRALATSGGAQVHDHIWDPVTGDVARHYLQVSVLGDDPVACDAWATAICARGPHALALAADRQVAALAVTGGRSEGGYDALTTPAWPSSWH
ncbi:FAD:protein FMN transferase [Demequina salsinemoris]|uniref:FAD:protein FMN transferase n=1 Tax=Demequina salsinemoris TaxID=577470 RepID=UPI000784796D|nr:FAD:protein FMN transferase [Demequina salsinemoris]